MANPGSQSMENRRFRLQVLWSRHLTSGDPADPADPAIVRPWPIEPDVTADPVSLWLGPSRNFFPDKERPWPQDVAPASVLACFDHQNHAKFMAETAKCRILGHYQFTRTTFDFRMAGLKLLEGMRFWRFISLGKWAITIINGYQWYYHLPVPSGELT